MTTAQQAQDKAVEALMDCYHAYGEHPDYKQSHALNNVVAQWIGDILTPAQITEAMAVCHDIHHRRTVKPDLFYKGHDIEPADEFYADALADYEHDNELVLYRIIQQAITTNNKE